MIVRYHDAVSRRCDGVLAQPPEVPRGPTFNLFSERFLSLLSAAERRRFRWRAVNVSNPTKITPALFEIVASEVHLAPVALRGGNPDREWCDGCGRHGPPNYPLVGCLPTWLNPDGESARREQPDLYVAAPDLPEPVPPWFTVGEWTRCAYLAVSRERTWGRARPPGTVGVRAHRPGVVGPHLIDPSV